MRERDIAGRDIPGGAVAPRRVLVTGGAGFIGASLVRALEARGSAVTVIDDGRAAGFGALDRTSARVVDGDVSDPSIRDVLRRERGHGAIVHLAARGSIPASIESPLEDLSVNLVGTVRLLEAAREAGIDRFVFASSNAALGSAEQPAREDRLPRAGSPYGAAKLASEAYLGAYHRVYGLTTTALRFSNAYGPFALHKTSVVPSFIRAYLRGGPLVVYGDGSQTRDLVHVDDLVSGIVAVLEAPCERVAGEVFQLGTGRETSVNVLLETLFGVGGSRVPVEHRPVRTGDVARSVSDIAKAHAVLGYRPRVTLEDGLARTLAWFGSADAKADAPGVGVGAGIGAMRTARPAS